jgi:hypothetical protein
MKMKIIFSTIMFFCLTYAVLAWIGESTFGSMSRSDIQALADKMINSGWTPHSTFSNYEYNDSSGNPVYSPNYVAGTTYYGIAYGQGYPQNNWNEFFSNINVTSSGKHAYGNDCSGFVSICWKLPARYTTSSFESGIGTYWSSLGPIGSVQSVNLLLGDALNSSYDGHMVMFLNYNSTGINTMEQTISGPNHLAKNWTRSYTYLVNQKYHPIRRNQIVESTTKAQMTSPANGSTFTSSSATFVWNAGSGVSDYYIFIGNSVGASDIYTVDQGTAQSRTISGLPTDGRTIYVRLWSLINGAWQFNDYTYRASSGATATEKVSTPPTPTGPASGNVGMSYTYSSGGSSSSFGNSVQYLFDWGDGTTSGWLAVGVTTASKSRSTAGTYTVKAQARSAANTSVVSAFSPGLSVSIIAGTSTTKAQMTSPANGSTFTSSSATFVWNAGSGVSDYYIFIGNSVGASDMYSYDQGMALSRALTGFPTDGRTIYVRLWSLINGAWQFNDYTYRASTH